MVSCFQAPPFAGITYSCSSPVRSLTNAMRPPSGLHVPYFSREPLVCVRFSASPSLAGRLSSSPRDSSTARSPPGDRPKAPLAGASSMNSSRTWRRSECTETGTSRTWPVAQSSTLRPRPYWKTTFSSPYDGHFTS